MTQQRISTLTIWNEHQGNAIALVVGQGMSQAEAAKVLGVDQATVQRRLQSAYEDVRTISDDGFEVVMEIPIFDA